MVGTLISGLFLYLVSSSIFWEMPSVLIFLLLYLLLLPSPFSLSVKALTRCLTISILLSLCTQCLYYYDNRNSTCSPSHFLIFCLFDLSELQVIYFFLFPYILYQILILPLKYLIDGVFTPFIF